MAKSTPVGDAKKAPGRKAPAKATSGKDATAAAPAAPARKAAKSASKNAAAATRAAAKKAATTAATDGPPAAFGAEFLAQQKQALLDERATYTRQAANLQAEADSLVADFEPGDVQFDEESGEGDTLNIERERDLALSAQARVQIEEIDHALEKFDRGTYGVCEISGELIPSERLEAIPWAREKVQYKTGGLGRR